MAEKTKEPLLKDPLLLRQEFVGQQQTTDNAALLATLQRLQERLDVLESRERVRQDAVARHAPVIDQEWEALKAAISRPASVRTQEMADQQYGTKAPRFKVCLDPTTEDGKTPKITEHFPLEISANSDLEAQARYQQIMGIRKHDYKIVAEPVAA